MEIVKGLHALIAKATVGYKGVDAVAVTYSTAAAIETVARKLREVTKLRIIAMVKGTTLDEALMRVRTLERAESIQLLAGMTRLVTGHVKCGPTYLDLEALREVLGVSSKKWDAAVLVATKRREPTLTINVSERK